MNSLKDKVLSVLLHVAELVVVMGLVVGIAYLAKIALGIDLTSKTEVVLLIVLEAVAKTLRVSDSVPVPDYVNESLNK